MRITGMKVEKVAIPLIAPFKVAFATVEALESVLIRIETDEGCVGFGEASPFAPVTGETVDGVIAVLDIFRQGLIGMDPMDIEAVHAMMDSVIVGNGAAKCAVDLAMYDLMGKAFGQPVYKLLGGFGSSVQSDITIGISTPEEMAAEAKKRVPSGFRGHFQYQADEMRRPVSGTEDQCHCGGKRRDLHGRLYAGDQAGDHGGFKPGGGKEKCDGGRLRQLSVL